LSVNADNILANVRRERVNAYIALYRAVGGGWDAKDLAAVVRTVQQNPRDILTGKLQ
jgi:predicted aminopeptidase